MPTPQLDPRDPESRIARLLDDGKFEFLLPRTDCGTNTERSISATSAFITPWLAKSAVKSRTSSIASCSVGAMMCARPLFLR